MASLSMPRPSRVVAAGCVLLGSSFAALDARAFCREITMRPPAGYEPTTSGCFESIAPSLPHDAGLFELYWSNSCVSYSLQSNASPRNGITLDQAKSTAAQAFATWQQAACTGGGSPSIAVSEMEPAGADSVDCDVVQYNPYGPNQHVIVFRDDGWPDNDMSNTLGLTTLTYDKINGEIFDADMEINSHDYPLVVTAPAPDGSYDLLSIMTHEAGHFLGLDHSTDATAVMYSHYRAGSTALQPDDVDGICAIDTPAGVHTTGNAGIVAAACDPTPRHGIRSQCAPEDDAGNVIPPEQPGTTQQGDQVMCDSHAGCSVGTAGAPELGLGGFAMVGAAAFLGRTRRRRRLASRGAMLAAILAIGTTAAGALLSRDASASVSIAVPFDDLVRDSTGAAIVIPIAQRSSWERGRIATYTQVRIDRPVAGDLPSELWIRTRGGEVGELGQIVDGEAMFALGQATLVFLRANVDPVTHAPGSTFVVSERAQGQFAIVRGADGQEHLVAATNVGALVPPSSRRMVELSRLHLAGDAPRLAREVLHERLLSDAAPDIAAAWQRLHAAGR